jgi:transposase
MAVADCHGLPVAVFVESATPHEVKLAVPTLIQMVIPEAPQNLIGDNAYDSDKLDAELRQYGIELIAPHRSNRRNKTQDARRLRRYRRRWKIERLFAWLQKLPQVGSPLRAICRELSWHASSRLLLNSITTYIGWLVVSLALSLLSCGGSSNGGGMACYAQQGTICQSLTISGVTRTYRLHVPSNFQRSTSALVIVLRGSGGNGLGMEIGTGFSALADQAGFAVVYPDGLLESNDGQTN